MSAILLALLVLHQASGGGASDPAVATIAAELEALRSGASPEEVALRLRGLGEDAPRLVLEAWGRDELAGSDGETLVLGREEREALRLGARSLKRDAFLSAWAAAAGSEDALLRRATIELVGELGAAGDLPLALRAATHAGARAAPSPQDAEALERAATALVARDPRTLTALRPAILATHPVLASGLVRAAGSHGGERALLFLGDLLGTEGLELPILSQMERVARAGTPPLEERHASRVRSYLAHPDRQIVRGAALCLGALQDEGALEELVELSASADAALAETAFVALESTTGLTLPRRSDRWRTWLQAEREWQRDHGPRLEAALASGNVPRVLSALRELAMHRLGRAETALMIVPLLEHGDRRVRAQALRTLDALGIERMAAELEDAGLELVEAQGPAPRG